MVNQDALSSRRFFKSFWKLSAPEILKHWECTIYVLDGKIWEAFPALKYYLHCGLIIEGLYYGFDLLDQSVLCILNSDFFLIAFRSTSLTIMCLKLHFSKVSPCLLVLLVRLIVYSPQRHHIVKF